MTGNFITDLLILIAVAVALGLVVTGLVYSGGGRRSKRYRPGRPFEFTPVWFLASPEHQSRSGVIPGNELVAASGKHAPRPRETGGASDRW